jgi:hypothetical protein
MKSPGAERGMPDSLSCSMQRSTLLYSADAEKWSAAVTYATVAGSRRAGVMP